MNDGLLAELEEIPWFASLGERVAHSANVRTIASWDDWPGPEDEGVMEIHSRQQSLYGSLLDSAKDKRGSAERLWEDIHKVVFRLGSKAIPYEKDKDAWHAPTTALWQAAWTAGLVGVCRLLGQVVPDDIQEQWEWYRRGHWPCALEERMGNKVLVIF